MHNLRLKLDAYYNHEGKDDKYRLEIPKGHYIIKFTPVSKLKNLGKIRVLKSAKVYFLGILIILSAVILYLWYHVRSIEHQLQYFSVLDNENMIWKEFLQSDLETVIVLGDHMFFSEFDEAVKRWRYIRDLLINSSEDLASFRQQFPGKILKDAAESYFPDGSIWSLPPVLCVLQPIQKQILLQRISNLTPQMLQEHNIIFLGSTKTLGLFNRYLLSSNIEYKLNPNTLFYRHENGTIVDTLETLYDNTTGYHKDYAIALKLPGPNNNVILIISSFFSSGVPEMARYLTNPETLTQLEEYFTQKYQKVSDYFGIVAEVRGVEKTGFYLEIKHLNEIHEEVKIW